ncbi:MAG: hypothetical protein IKM98_10115, partial [Bacteroidales bacterium]|nr:hypothetical protein [Bacteroidales bacterium]
FLPAAGYFNTDGTIINDKSSGYYWSSSLMHLTPMCAICLIFDPAFESKNSNSGYRCYGYSIRPVRSKNQNPPPQK